MRKLRSGRKMFGGVGMNDPQTGTGQNFDFNRPTIISLCYLGSFLVGITALVGLVLAYVWQGESQEPWEASHYRFHIRTFWFGLLGSLISALLVLVLIGFVGFFAVAAWVIVRSVIALLAAQKRQPMPNPDTLLW